jgi:coenzyme F420-reducing hydrogenase delta subunit
MVPRTDGKIHKFVAQENLDLCVSCGLCVGSCSVQAISVGLLSHSALWAIVSKKVSAARERTPTGKVTVVFTCERHADNGARPYLQPMGSSSPDAARDVALEVITLPCTASAPPDLIARSLDIGATEARVVGCAPGDCARREGNAWAEGRLTRNRLPRLRRNYANAPIGLYWLPPDDFAQALREPLALALDRSASGRIAAPVSWRNLIPALMLVAILYAASIALNWVPYVPYADGQARVQIVLPSPSDLFEARSDERTIAEAQSDAPVRLILKADDRTLFEQTYTLADLLSDQTACLFKDIVLSPGKHHVRFQFESDTAMSRTVRIYDRTITLEAGEILLLDYVAGAARDDRHRP